MHSLMKLSAAATAALLLVAPAATAKGAGPFGGLAGGWSGGGSAAFDGGQTEKLRCNATYRPSGGGNSLSMSIRCATASLNVQLNGNLRHSGGRVFGSWSESTTGSSGSAAGRASAGSMRLRFSGTFAGTMSVSFSGARQSVTIATSGTGLRRANVSLHRR